MSFFFSLSLFVFGPFLSFCLSFELETKKSTLSIVVTSLFSEAPKRITLSLSFDDDDDDDDDDDVWTGKTVRKGRGLREGARFFSCSCSSCCCSRDFFFFFFRESDCVASFQNAIGGKDASSFSSVRELQISDTPSSKLTIVSLTTPSRTDTRPKR